MRRNRIYTDIELIGLHSAGRSFGYIGPKRIYLDFGIPGERISANEVRREGDYLRGSVCEVTSPVEGRQSPFCKHYGLCGGCEWQHMEYGEQLRWKRQLLINALSKYAIPATEIPLPLPSPEFINYRQKLEYSFSARRWYHEGEGRIEDPVRRQALGFHLINNPYKVLDIEECYLQPEPGRKIYEAVKEISFREGYSYFDPKEKTGFLQNLIIRVNRKGEAMVIIVFCEDNPLKIKKLLEFIKVSVPEIVSLWYTILPDIQQSWQDQELIPYTESQPYLEELANGLSFRMSPGSFYQPNPAQAENIFSSVRKLADLKGNETVYDLYSGIGTLGLSVAGKAKQVIGIEGSHSAVKDAEMNAKLNGFSNCYFVNGDVLGTFTSEFIEKHGKPDLVILDPPRSGTLIEIKKTILAASPQKIIYLSCNPLSLAFDLKMLTQGYEITYIQAFDQFPHTHHLETLVMLEGQT
ncbi:MAG: 23S rRNA (uracil(1939)-C(5))-methyltransferase RlmD [Bacteroidetes bacterium]|nr:23S rRNA (uracil(1939)-C(5))-methyltransferase RlmD [Bacteroidota bacterium]